jgi:hypothetical protein
VRSHPFMGTAFVAVGLALVVLGATARSAPA